MWRSASIGPPVMNLPSASAYGRAISPISPSPPMNRPTLRIEQANQRTNDGHQCHCSGAPGSRQAISARASSISASTISAYGETSFMQSAIASTTAADIHRPRRYKATPQIIGASA